MDIEGLKYWFDLNAKGKKPAYWSLKEDGKAKHSNFDVDDNTASWEMLERMIVSGAANGIRLFEITSKTSKTDPQGRTFKLKVPYTFGSAGQGQQQQSTTNTAIAGIGGMAGIGEIMRLQSEKSDARIEAVVERYEARLAARDIAEKERASRELLEGRIWSLENEKKSVVDKVIERIEESPQLQEICKPFIHGLAGAFFPPAAQVQIAGMPNGATVPVQTNQVDGTPAPAQEQEEEEGCDFNLVIQAAGIMNAAGIKNADEKINFIAQVAAQNPAEFAMMYETLEAKYKN